MAKPQNQKLVFSEIDRLADYLSQQLGGGKKTDGHEVPTGTVDPKRYPIVLGSCRYPTPLPHYRSLMHIQSRGLWDGPPPSSGTATLAA